MKKRGEKLDGNKILKSLENKKSYMKSKGVKKLGLFGSYLKGEQKKGSDIDILVEFDEMNYDNYYETLVFLRKLFGKKVDLVIENSLRPELKYVKKEAKYVKI